MKVVSVWLRRRQWTLGLAVFFVAWYALQLSVSQLFGEDVARWWFYFEQPPYVFSPGMVLAPLSHDLDTLRHIGANLLLLLFVGGLAEPYIGKDMILVHVIGLGYLGTFVANSTVIIHHMWILAGASGGIFALWAYAGFRMKQQIAEHIFNGLTWSRQSVETVGAVSLLIGIPFLLFHETLWTDQPHSGHTIGILLGCLSYGVESYLGPVESVLQ